MSQPTALIVNGSPRKRGNTAWLTSLVAEYLQRNGVQTKVVSAVALKSVNNGCTGCEGCQRSGQYLCVFKDDVQPLVASMPSYDYVIFTTPVYFFGPSAQLKLVLDRMFSLIKSDSDGKYSHPFEPRTKFGLIVTAGGDENDGCDLVVDIFKRTAEIMERPLEELLMPLAPMSPEEIKDPEQCERQAHAFCDRLLAR